MSNKRQQIPKNIWEDPVSYVTLNGEQFIKNSSMLYNRCTKPDVKEFKKLAAYTAGGFVLLGFVGYLVKAISIPVNSMLIG